VVEKFPVDREKPAPQSPFMPSARILRVSLPLLFLTNLLAFSGEPPSASAHGVQITQLTNRLRVDINGQLFTEYYFKDVPRPYCYPLVGPGGAAMTRNWPMKTTTDEAHDHPHHRSLWFAHGAVNGHDFWTEAANCGKIVHEQFLEIKSGKDSGTIKSRNNWIAADGVPICSDTRTLRVLEPTNPNERIFDFEITLQASHGPLTLGDTKEGTMSIRLAETMKFQPPGKGHIVNSSGLRDKDAWGKQADWCDYYGPVDGKTVGVAIFDHPQNPHHPTWWHVRDYGLFAANPFGRHDFEKLADTTAGSLTIPAGQSVTFRYRFYLHAGTEKDARVAEKYQDYIKAM
jgi:hypothetical protein